VRTNHDPSAANVDKRKGFLFSLTVAVLLEKHEISVRMQKLLYLKREFFFAEEGKGRGR
jgi:hypothetical protein